MSLIKLLKTTSARVSINDRWLVWSEDDEEWTVYYRPAYAKKTRTLYSGDNLESAIAFLEGYL